ncbi:MAG: hypothetical protein RR348_00280 [Clostridia bacterium]
MTEEQTLELQQKIFELKCEQKFENKDHKKEIEQLTEKLKQDGCMAKND